MRVPRAGDGPGTPGDRWLEAYLDGARENVRAPHGFTQKVMDAVYREALAGRSLPAGAAHVRGFPAGPAPAAVAVRQGIRALAGSLAGRPTVSRMYRRLGVSFMLTAAVLAVSLLLPHGGYPTLIRSGSNDALGAGPSAAVQSALIGAGHAVQGALGEQQIGGNQE
jgi:hypothetical protein